VKVRRLVGVDDCGTVINPMIAGGQIYAGLTEGFAIAYMQEIAYDENSNRLSSNFTEHLIPTAVETPRWELNRTLTPSPHHPLGTKGAGESANVGSPAALVNAAVDAQSHLRVRHIDTLITPWKIQKILREHGITE
jgi:carbon-monoxide dehydrogenase large subunit